MRIVEVRFFPWGPFEDLRLDLEGDFLHVVHGRNEAGKSSALRGIRAALFGVPLRTADDFRHEMGKLAGGARLRLALGALDAEAAALFSPRASNPLLNQAATEYREALRVLKEASLPADLYQEIERSLEGAVGERNRVRLRVRDLRAEA